MPVTVVINRAQMADIRAELKSYQGAEMEKRLRKATLEAAQELRSLMRAAAPTIRGKMPSDGYPRDLKGSIAIEAIRSGRQWIGYRVAPNKRKGWYAPMVIGGTRPHDIEPKNASVLRTPWGPRRIVHHRGARANPFIDRLGSEAEGLAYERMRRSIVKQRQKVGF